MIDQQIIDQVILIHNNPFASVFNVADSNTLYEGIISPVFEIYLFQPTKSNSIQKQYKLIDSMAQGQKKVELRDDGNEKQGIFGKVSLMDLILTMIKEDLISQEMQTVYIYTTRLSIDGNFVVGSSSPDNNGREAQNIKQKIERVTLEVEIKAIDGLNENIMI